MASERSEKKKEERLIDGTQQNTEQQHQLIISLYFPFILFHFLYFFFLFSFYVDQHYRRWHVVDLFCIYCVHVDYTVYSVKRVIKIYIFVCCIVYSRASHFSRWIHNTLIEWVHETHFFLIFFALCVCVCAGKISRRVLWPTFFLFLLLMASRV